MTKRITIKPAPGLKIRKPAYPFPHLAQDGEEVTLDSFWVRRLQTGDVIEVKPAPAAPSKGDK